MAFSSAAMNPLACCPVSMMLAFAPVYDLLGDFGEGRLRRLALGRQGVAAGMGCLVVRQRLLTGFGQRNQGARAKAKAVPPAVVVEALNSALPKTGHFYLLVIHVHWRPRPNGSPKTLG